MKVKAYGSGYILLPLGTEVICETEEGDPLKYWRAYDNSSNLITPRLNEAILIITDRPAHVGGLKYRTVANGESRPFKIEPGKLYSVKKTWRGDAYSFSSFQVEEV